MSFLGNALERSLVVKKIKPVLELFFSVPLKEGTAEESMILLQLLLEKNSYIGQNVITTSNQRATLGSKYELPTLKQEKLEKG